MKMFSTYHGVPIVWFVIPLFLLIFVFTSRGEAQVIQAADTTIVEADSAGIITPANQDSVIQANGHAPAQAGQLKKGEVQFQASDSLVFDFKNDRIVYLYGEGKVEHQSGTLKAGKVKLNLDKNLVEASTVNPGIHFHGLS